MTHRVLPKTEQLPRALYRAAQVRDLDRQVIERFEVPGAALMERAGSAAFKYGYDRWPEVRRCVVLCGTGNNGGDGFVFALQAQAAGWQVRVLQLGEPDSIGGDARLFADQWREAGGHWGPFEQLPPECDLIVDAMLGTGLQRDLGGQYRVAVEAANRHRAPKLALDLPTGLHADTGVALGGAIRAQATVTFIGLKQGMFTAEGVDCCGDIRFEGLGVPAAVYAGQVPAARRVSWSSASDPLAPRVRSSHKGHFGHLLVVGGDHGYGGAVRLAGEAAARCGAGLVSIATREAHVAGLLAARPELMAHAVDHTHALEPLLAAAGVVLVGPGLGTKAWGRALFEAVLRSGRRLVLDADALNLLADMPAQARPAPDDWVYTPHPGEAARMLSVCVAEIQGDRFAAAESLQRRFGGWVVLKGAGTLMTGPARVPPALCSDGNPGMASGGMGDVLGGVIGSLLAQGRAPRDAVEQGVCVHAAAADRAAAAGGERGLLASDLMPQLRGLMNNR